MPVELKSLRVEFSDSPSLSLIGAHSTMVRLRALIERVAPVDATVLITGESGTGKEVVARMIHAASPRHAGAFVPVNCAAIPSELLESAMFGHERGAFTGAEAQRQGLFCAANHGTIFLDEVDELSLRLQAKLLRVLEDRMVRPVGSDRAARIDARVIAASNNDLPAMVAKGAFRSDLFYRLQVVPITIPPLRRRRADIPALIDHFLARAQTRLARRFAISGEAMVHLCSYDWPGNVRELENVIERLAILCEDSTVDSKHLPHDLTAGSRIGKPPPSTNPGGMNLNAQVRELEGHLINEALRRTGGNKQAAAQLLGLKRTTFTAKLRRCGVIARQSRPEPQGRESEDDQ